MAHNEDVGGLPTRLPVNSELKRGIRLSLSAAIEEQSVNKGWIPCAKSISSIEFTNCWIRFTHTEQQAA
jgi:hypothetical protein